MIELSRVCKTYETGSKAVKDISLTIDDGEFVFITGRSGSGKSTLIKLLMKELDPTKGRIVVNDMDLGKMPRRYVAEMVMDRISASRTYLGDAYDNHKPLEYFLKSKPKLWFVHPQTKKELEGLLRILNDKGEEKALWYIKHVYLKGKDK